MTADTLIRNGKIVTTEGIFEAAIAVSDGKIAALGSGDTLPLAARVIDAKGNYIIPGLVDGHAHFFGPPSNWTEWLKTETSAYAAGGCTTAITMQEVHAKGSILEAWEKTTKAIQEGSYIDWAVNSAIFTRGHVDEMQAALDRGISSFKFLLSLKGRGVLFGLPPLDEGTVYLGLEQIGKLVKEGYRTFARIHAETIEIPSMLEDRFLEQGTEPSAYTELRPGFVEAEAMQRIIAFAKASGCPLFIVHVSIKEGPAIIAKAKAEGVDIVGETCPHYLLLNTKNSDNKFVSKVIPPIRYEEDNAALWRALAEGTIDFVGTDHVPFTREDRGTDFWKGQPGLGGVETWLPIMLSEGVNKKRITLERLVQVCCYNPAKKYGLTPKKGMIAVGSDADLVILDLNKVAKVNAKDLHTRARDFYSYTGWEFKGWPVLTMLRGSIIMENGKVVGNPGFGRYVPANIK